MSVWLTKATGGNSCIDRTEVLRALKILVDRDQTFEVRCLPIPPGRTARFLGSDLDSAVEFIDSHGGGNGTYYTLNYLVEGLAKSAADRDVIGRRWLLIDIDPVKAEPDESSTEEEKGESGEIANKIIDYLCSRGWPHGLLIDSGNGWHVLYRIDLPNDPLSRQIVKDVLYELDRRFSNDGAKVDKGMHNAARISKLPGTWARKGSGSADRPHRMAQLLFAPDPIEIVTVDKLKALVDPEEETDAPPAWLNAWVTRTTNEDRQRYIESAIVRECARILSARPGAAEGRNNALNLAAFNLGTLSSDPRLNPSEVKARLRQAAKQSGLGDHEIESTMESGWASGSHPSKVRPAPSSNGTYSKNGSTPPGGPPKKHTIKASAVAPKTVKWIWRNRIAIGFITLFAGRTSVGKSFVTHDISARLTTGRPMPEESTATDPISVLIISEDPFEYVLTPRLKELGADLNRVHFLTWESMASYSMSDLGMLEEAYQESGRPKLIVIDPPTNFLGGKDEHKNAEVRMVLMGLVGWLNAHDVAAILITHVNKQVGKGLEAIDRIMGSVAWASTSRVACSFSADPNNPSRCLFAGVKNNLGEKAPTLSYEIVKTETLAKVEWHGVIDISADDAMNGSPKKSRGQTAVEWLIEQFNTSREWESAELFRHAKESGFSRNALFSPEVAALPLTKKRRFTADGQPYWVWAADDGWPPVTPQEN